MKKKFSLDNRTCPLRATWCSFRLVDEFGNGAPYAGLPYVLIDEQDATYTGILDSDGYAKQENMFCGPVRLDISAPYSGVDPWYEHLQLRKKFPLPITALQAAAEQTRSSHRGIFEAGLPDERAERENATLYCVEVADFLTKKTVNHLPPITVKRNRPLSNLIGIVKSSSRYLGKEEPAGVPLEADTHHIFEVKALRAYRPLLSTDKAFCALNAYHLAMMSVLAYAPFDGIFGLPKIFYPPHYINRQSIAEVLYNQWSQLHKPTQFNTASPFHLLHEDVPYSKRMEVVPYAPQVYTDEAKDDWELPEQVHHLNHQDTDTQAFITHSDQVVLISVRGTQGNADLLRDLDAKQVPFDEGEGNAHRGFHGAFLATKKFISDYLSAFHVPTHQIIVTGHSLGGAIATLVAEWLRRKYGEKIQLYTFGAPRTGNKAFVRGAATLTHHRLINRDDPIPSVPIPWLDKEWKKSKVSLAVMLAAFDSRKSGWERILGSLVSLGEDDFEHHGEQRHFIPRNQKGGAESSVLWQPQSAVLEQGKAIQYNADILLEGDEPRRIALMRQFLSIDDHSSDGGYAVAALSNLLRCIAAAWHREGQLFTPEERKELAKNTEGLSTSLQGWQPEPFPALEQQLAQHPDQRFANTTTAQRMAMYDEDLKRLEALRTRETQNLRRTYKRLKAQSEFLVTKHDVFGNQVEHPELQEMLAQWLALTDIQRAAQLVKVELPSNMEVA